MLRRFRKLGLVFAVAAAVGGLYGWWRRDELLACYYFHELDRASDAERKAWLQKLVELDEGVRPAALECLCSAAPKSCAAGEEVLCGLARNWKDVRSASLLKDLATRWHSFSDAGRSSALVVARVVLEESSDNSPIQLQCEISRDLLQCATDAQAERAALHLAMTLTRLQPAEMPEQLLASLVERGLRCPDFDVRSLALRLLLQAPFNNNDGLLLRAAPFLQDVSAEVRCVALLAVGSRPDVVSDDELLPLLHDADAEVCRLCELALRGRGLDDQHMTLARLIGDERPAARLEVLHLLESAGDLDAGVWLRRLCQDPAAAVRAAAVRAAGCQNAADLRDCLRDMAQNDVSPTVRQLAAHYLQQGMLRQVRWSN